MRGISFGYDMLWCRMHSFNYCKMRICLDVMQELGLIVITRKAGEEPVISVPEQSGKISLEQSTILRQLKVGE